MTLKEKLFLINRRILQFTSSPICCPSRASILTGLYAHNTGTFNNSKDGGGCYSDHWIKNHESETFPAILKGAGYETFYAGKYLNEYYSAKVPVGYDQFYGLHGNSKYYNYTLTENGKLVHYNDAPENYLTNVIKQKALSFIQSQSVAKPFFAMLSVPAAHEPFTPEHKYKGFHKNESIPRGKNFNVGAKPYQKHWLMTMEPEVLPDDVLETIDEFYRLRLDTLLSVDDLVEEIILQLNKQKLMEDTYIIFTSDHGFHLGQWAMPFDKRQPYETDIRVPLIIRGPSVPMKATVSTPVMLIDLAPTILNLAKVEIDYDSFDGHPFDHVFTRFYSGEIEDRKMLIEYWGEGNEKSYNPACPYKKNQRLDGCRPEAACKCQDSWNNTYACVRHFSIDDNFLFCVFRDHENYQEAYDLSTDVHQLENIGFDILPSMQAHYQILIDNLRACKGDSCRNH